MKKIILLTALFIACTIVYSQNSLLIKDHTGTTVLNNDTFYVSGNVADFEIIEEFIVTNNSASTIDVEAKKNDVSLISGTEHAFCWALYCYPAATSVSSYSYIMSPSSSTSGSQNLSSHYRPWGNTGTSTITLTVYDKINPSDSAMVTVIFNGVTDIEKTKSEFYISSPYPNPSNTKTTFNYKLNGAEAYISVYDIVGNRVCQYRLAGNQFTLNTEQLHSGMYFYAFTVNNKKQETKRLIVVH